MKPDSGFFSGIVPVWPLKLVMSFGLLITGVHAMMVDPAAMVQQAIGVPAMIIGSAINFIHYRIIKSQAAQLGHPSMLITTGGLF